MPRHLRTGEDNRPARDLRLDALDFGLEPAVLPLLAMWPFSDDLQRILLGLFVGLMVLGLVLLMI